MMEVGQSGVHDVVAGQSGFPQERRWISHSYCFACSGEECRALILDGCGF